MRVRAAFIFFVLLLSSLVAARGQNYSIQQYLSIRSATSPAFSPDDRHLVYLTNTSGTYQVWSTDLPNGKPRQLTNYDDEVGFVRWLGDGTGIIFGKAAGGDENTQFYWMKPDGSAVRPLTSEPDVQHRFGVVSDDGGTVAYSSNKRNRNYFDVYAMNVTTGKEALLYQNDGDNNVLDMDISGKLIISREGTELSLDNDLYLIVPNTKTEVLLTPHTGAAEFSNAHFVADGIIYTHNNGREFISLAQMRKKNASGNDWSAANRETRIIDAPGWDVDGVEMRQFGSKIAYTINHNSVSELYLRKYETDGKPLITTISQKSEKLWVPPQGIVTDLTFSRDESKLAFSSTSPNHTEDIWVHDLKTGIVTQVTHSDLAGISDSSFREPRLVTYKTFDGRDISAWYYEPQRRTFAATAKDHGESTVTITPVPVIVSVHGGPEGQEQPWFVGQYQYYLSRGYAIFAPNVRGSTGYGKSFTHLDDVRKREDAVKDLKYGVDWLTTKGRADPKKIGIFGGSYGGYMALAAITLYPELWAAAVDMSGPANWETFLKNTSGYRRRAREVEYGRLDRDLDFLRSISPINKVDRIRTPLFVVQGRNDPRVPYTEAEQIVAALKKRGAVVQYKLYADEGHGIAKLKNRLELYPLVADFLDANIKK